MVRLIKHRGTEQLISLRDQIPLDLLENVLYHNGIWH